MRRLRKALASRKFRGTVLELAGLALVVAAAWQVAAPLGLAAAGLALIGVALALEGP